MSNKLNPSDLSKKEFKQWLSSKSPCDKVGTVSRANKCPIATFIKEHYKISSVSVCCVSTEIFEHEISKVYINPLWVKEFTRKIDQSSIPVSITAKKALEVLNSL